MNEKEQKAADCILDAIVDASSDRAVAHQTRDFAEPYCHLCEAFLARVQAEAQEREMQADYDNR